MISLALGMLLLAVPQDKTVEDRIRELEARLDALEKRAASAKANNAKLKKKLADAELAKERYIRGRAGAWVKQYAEPAEFSKERCAELEKLWIGWVRADFGKRPDKTAWKTREGKVRKLLTSDEAARLAKAVRSSQEKYARGATAKFVEHAEIDGNRRVAFETAVLARIRFPESALLLSAHPDEHVDWAAVYRAVEGVVPDLEGVLVGEELTRLQALVEKWKPRPARFKIRPAPEE